MKKSDIKILRAIKASEEFLKNSKNAEEAAKIFDNKLQNLAYSIDDVEIKEGEEVKV